MASEGRIDVDVAQMAVQAGQVIAQLLDVVIQQAATVEDVGLGGRSKSINVLFHAEASQLTRGLYKAPQLPGLYTASLVCSATYPVQLVSYSRLGEIWRRARQLAMALLAGDVTTEEAMIHCRDVLHRSNINSDVIRYHHHKMRESSDSDFGEVAALAWVQATTDKKQLVSYAAAARVTGEQQWVRQGNDWCVERALEWLRRGGAQQAQLKELRRQYFEEH
eukprot:gene4025-4994_t